MNTTKIEKTRICREANNDIYNNVSNTNSISNRYFSKMTIFYLLLLVMVKLTDASANSLLGNRKTSNYVSLSYMMCNLSDRYTPQPIAPSVRKKIKPSSDKSTISIVDNESDINASDFTPCTTYFPLPEFVFTDSFNEDSDAIEETELGKEKKDSDKIESSEKEIKYNKTNHDLNEIKAKLEKEEIKLEVIIGDMTKIMAEIVQIRQDLEKVTNLSQ
jgi:hypothetical protein